MLAVALPASLSACRLIPAGDWEAVEALDEDGDGWLPDDTGDCNDADSAVFPGAQEVCGDGEVNGCGGVDTAVARCKYPGVVYPDEEGPTLVGPEAGSLFGADLASPGDLSGDGVADLAIVGAGEAVVQVVPGPLGTRAVIGEAGETLSASSGAEVMVLSAPGDLDEDDVQDLLIGVVDADERGLVYVLYGPTGEGTRALSGLTTYTREALSDSESGIAVSGGGDYDLDGAADLIVGAPGRRDGEGVVYLLLGPLSGAADLSAAAGFKLEGNEGYRLGTALAQRGDVDGDGVADLLVGAPKASDGFEFTYGVAFLEPGPLADTMAVEDVQLTLYGDAGTYDVGLNVEIGRDLDGDGLDDVVLQAVGFNGYYGNAVLVHYDLDLREQTWWPAGSADGIIVDESDAYRFGYDLGVAEDLDADGYSDLLLARPDALLLDEDDAYGSVHLVYSPLSGWGTVDQVSAATLTARGTFGVSLAWGPDTNGDGIPEILAGAPTYDADTGRSAGAIFLVNGGFY